MLVLTIKENNKNIIVDNLNQFLVYNNKIWFLNLKYKRFILVYNLFYLLYIFYLLSLFFLSNPLKNNSFSLCKLSE